MIEITIWQLVKISLQSTSKHNLVVPFFLIKRPVEDVVANGANAEPCNLGGYADVTGHRDGAIHKVHLSLGRVTVSDDPAVFTAGIFFFLFVVMSWVRVWG